MEPQISSIQELQKVSQGEIVQLPPFREGTTFVVKMKRPSMMNLVRTGKIPNSLVKSASKLFNGKGVDDRSDKAMSQAFDVFETLCEAALVQPTYKELKEAGIELTDEQLMAIFNYTQRGLKALESFRIKSPDSEPAGSSTEV